MCAFAFVCAHVYALYVLVPWMPEGTGFPGTGDRAVNCLVWALGTSLGTEEEQGLLLTAEPPLRLRK